MANGSGEEILLCLEVDNESQQVTLGKSSSSSTSWIYDSTEWFVFESHVLSVSSQEQTEEVTLQDVQENAYISEMVASSS